MEITIGWISFLGMIAIPIVGAIFNGLITNKLNAIDKHIENTDKIIEENKKLFFDKLDQQKVVFVRQDLCQQSHKYIKEETDTKFNHLLEKIEDLRNLIIDNLKK
jgi:glutamyl-tRNA reductase